MTRQLTEQMQVDAQVQPLSGMEIASREALREAVIRRTGVCIFAANEVCEHRDLRVLPLVGLADGAPVPLMPLVREYLYCLKDRRGITADRRLLDRMRAGKVRAGRKNIGTYWDLSGIGGCQGRPACILWALSS